MEDSKIIELYFKRNEAAIEESLSKYSKYCYKISYNILYNNEDAEECVNDTFTQAWSTIPPNKPKSLKSFLGRIARNLSINRYNQNNTQKRGGGEMPLLLSELEELISSKSTIDDCIDSNIISNILNGFLSQLSKTERIVFVRRYWYLCSIKDIAKQYDMSDSKVKSMLFRTRSKLREKLEEEGIFL